MKNIRPRQQFMSCLCFICQLLLDVYRHNFSRKKIDLIIAYATPSLSLVIAHGKDLFPQTPVVFFGIPRAQLQGLNLSPMITGVLPDIDSKKTGFPPSRESRNNNFETCLNRNMS